jgi:CubicO group peptidase (beta-lactamase class C family)
MQNHKLLYHHISGVSDYEAMKPLTEDNVYMMYSCTKAMTCTCALQLYEKGLIGLDDPVSKYLPAFENVFLMADGHPIPPKKTMTIRHLFTMSAGLDYQLKAQPILDTIAKNPHATTIDIVNSLTLSPIHFEPGTRFQYSLCHDVLGAIIEVVSGKKLSDYMKENIWEPLGMKDIGFHIPQDVIPRLVALYQCTGPGSYEPFDNLTDFNMTDCYESGGAGLYSTAESYSLFVDAMACGGIGGTGNRILKSETIDLMRTEQLNNYLTDPQYSCAAGPGYGFGLGVRTLIDKSQGQRSSIGEFGWDGAAGSYMMMDPKYGLSIFFAMHVRGWPAIIGDSHARIRDLTYEVLGL